MNGERTHFFQSLFLARLRIVELAMDGGRWQCQQQGVAQLVLLLFMYKCLLSHVSALNSSTVHFMGREEGDENNLEPIREFEWLLKINIIKIQELLLTERKELDSIDWWN